MVKKFALLGLCLIIIGVVGSVTTFSSISSGNKQINVNETEKINSESIEAITINVEEIDVEIIESENNEVKVELVGGTTNSVEPNFIVEQKGTELVIKVKEKPTVNLFRFYSPTLTLTVYLPTKAYQSIEVEGVSTDIYLDNLNADVIKLSTISGDIEGEKIASKKMEINTVSGDVELVEMTGESTIESKSGDISLEDYDLTGPINVNTISGDIYIATLVEPKDVKYKVKTVSGDIDLYSTYNATAKIGTGALLVTLETISGDITMESNE